MAGDKRARPKKRERESTRYIMELHKPDKSRKGSGIRKKRQKPKQLESKPSRRGKA